MTLRQIFFFFFGKGGSGIEHLLNIWETWAQAPILEINWFFFYKNSTLYLLDEKGFYPLGRGGLTDGFRGGGLGIQTVILSPPSWWSNPRARGCDVSQSLQWGISTKSAVLKAQELYPCLVNHVVNGKFNWDLSTISLSTLLSPSSSQL